MSHPGSMAFGFWFLVASFWFELKDSESELETRNQKPETRNQKLCYSVFNDEVISSLFGARFFESNRAGADAV